MKINVNEHYNFDIELDKDVVMVNGTVVQTDSSLLSERRTHVIYNHKSYNIEIVSENKEEKTCLVKVNGNTYNIKIEDQYDQLLKKLGLDNTQANKVKAIKAPMPGLVIKVVVTEGAEVQKGDNLLVLEAMKMENIIKSPSDGIVKKISVVKGDKVEKNEILIEFV